MEEEGDWGENFSVWGIRRWKECKKNLIGTPAGQNCRIEEPGCCGPRRDLEGG